MTMIVYPSCRSKNQTMCSKAVRKTSIILDWSRFVKSYASTYMIYMHSREDQKIPDIASLNHQQEPGSASLNFTYTRQYQIRSHISIILMSCNFFTLRSNSEPKYWLLLFSASNSHTLLDGSSKMVTLF